MWCEYYHLWKYVAILITVKRQVSSIAAILIIGQCQMSNITVILITVKRQVSIISAILITVKRHIFIGGNPLENLDKDIDDLEHKIRKIYENKAK
jgi:hypothetical protein